MLYLQMLSVVACLVVGVLFTGAGFINSWSLKVSGTFFNILSLVLIGVILFTLGLYLPLVYGWVSL